MDRSPIYLDHAATTIPDETVVAAMADCMRQTPYNASAAYSAAGDARHILRACRRRLSSLLTCPPEDVFFTSGGTEANNWAVKAFAGHHAVISAIEHHSILEAAHAAGCRIALVYPDETGHISPDAVTAAIRPETKLICVQAANNETGVIQPVRDIYAIAKARRIHLHVDAVQAFGHIPVDASLCDSMSVSAHKLYGPRGVGALYIRGGARIPAMLHGGAQESGLRAGTENTPAIRGFEVAAQLAGEDMQLRAKREGELLSAFCSQLKTNVPGLRLLGEGRERLPGIAALLLPGVSSEQAIASLDLKHILVSGGAACASRSGKPSHVYTAMGLSPEEAACVIRVSIGRHTTTNELAYAAAAIEALIPQPAHQNTSR